MAFIPDWVYTILCNTLTDVATICTGMATSMGADVALEQQAKTVKTFKSDDSSTLGGASGQASDIEITAREIQKLKTNCTKSLLVILANLSMRFGKWRQRSG